MSIKAKGLKEARKKAGLTQMEVARYCEKSLQWARDVENLAYGTTQEMINKIKELVGEFEG